MATTKPRVFISHAGEDKERFVIPFASKLLDHGVDVWVDKWEMLPGDSIIDKIFEEGIKNAHAFIIILSKNSVQKRWVKEELNAGLIKRISGKTKVIPVVIEDCEIPEALKSIVWERIKNIDSYEEELHRIIAAVYEDSLKPAIGSTPKYTQLAIDTPPGISKIDMMVLKASCEKSIENGRPFINTSEILTVLNDDGIQREQIYESLEILSETYFIKAERELGADEINLFSVTHFGFENYAQVFIHGFDDLVRNIFTAIVNTDLSSNHDVTKKFGISEVVVDYVLDILESRNYVKLIRSIDGTVSILGVSASGRRAARGI